MKSIPYVHILLALSTLFLATAASAVSWSSWSTWDKQYSIYYQSRDAHQPGFGFVGSEYRIKNKSDDDICVSIWVDDGYNYKDMLEEDWTYIPAGRTKRLGAVRGRGDGDFEFSVSTDTSSYDDGDC